LLEKFKKFYEDNYDMVVDYQINKVKRGTEQPVLNYMVQQEGIDINILPIKYGVNHLFRWQVLQGNWQLKEDPTPFFIKYFYVWIYSGFPDRGATRNQMMKQTWDAVKHHYHEQDGIDQILDQVKHKDTAKYTVSRKFKRDILEFLGDNYKDKIGLELGTSQGQTTRVLSYAFKKVISVELDDWNIEQAHITCNGRDNVEIRKFDLYQEVWDFPKDVAVVFIDANHTYEGVMSDIQNSLSNFEDPILILDDYGHPSGGIKQAVDQLVLEQQLEIIKQIGEEKVHHLAGYENVDVEGVICRRKNG
jgi:predicted O-methyltransferase YrrM